MVELATPGTVEPPPVRSPRLASLAALAARIAAERRALAGSSLMTGLYPVAILPFRLLKNLAVLPGAILPGML